MHLLYAVQRIRAHYHCMACGVRDKYFATLSIIFFDKNRFVGLQICFCRFKQLSPNGSLALRHAVNTLNSIAQILLLFYELTYQEIC